MARLRVVAQTPTTCSLLAALLTAACGPGGQGVSPRLSADADRPREGVLAPEILSGVASPGGERASPRDPAERMVAGLRLVVRARGELEEVRHALADGSAERAGTSLARTIRDLEEGMALAGTRLSLRSATAFEQARRSAARWRAGETPARVSAESIVRLMEDESDTLARALDPR